MTVAAVVAALAIGGGCVPHTVATPSLPAFLDGVAVSRDGDVWAVGSRNVEHGLALHSRDGRRFVAVRLPAKTGELRRVAALTADDAYAIGIDGIYHWDGKRWSKTGPNGSFWGISARAANDVWAVGGDNEVAHWDGHSWKLVSFLPVAASHTTTSPGQVTTTFGYLEAVLSRGPADVWIVGTGADQRPVTAHWNGKVWSAYPVQAQFTGLGSLTATASGVVWASGGVRGGSVVAQWNGRRWVVRSHSYGLTDIASRGDEVWTVLDDHLARWSGSAWVAVETRHPNLAQNGLAIDRRDEIWVAGNTFGTHPRAVVRVFRCR